MFYQLCSKLIEAAPVVQETKHIPQSYAIGMMIVVVIFAIVFLGWLWLDGDQPRRN